MRARVAHRIRQIRDLACALELTAQPLGCLRVILMQKHRAGRVCAGAHLHPHRPHRRHSICLSFTDVIKILIQLNRIICNKHQLQVHRGNRAVPIAHPARQDGTSAAQWLAVEQ